MEGRELRRSYTQLEFPVSKGARAHYHQGGGQRGQSNKRYQQQQQQQQQQGQQRSKFPTQEIYRPPSQRDPDISKSSKILNVHAKEFAPLGSSLPLQSSKSTGNVLVAVNNENKAHRSHKTVGFPLGHSKTAHHQLHQKSNTTNSSSNKGAQQVQQESSMGLSSQQKPNQLQRSKSTTSAVPKPIDLSIFGKKASLVESVYNS